jgi:homocysteine S-methyltransferase
MIEVSSFARLVLQHDNCNEIHGIRHHTVGSLFHLGDGLKNAWRKEMTKYRNDLPQLNGGIFLADGGVTTELVFLEGLELPHFASFILLETEAGLSRYRAIMENYLRIAREHQIGIVLDTPTWRANPDWGAKLGYDAGALRRANIGWVNYLIDLRSEWEMSGTPCVINGVIGPRSDGYRTGDMDCEESQAYHNPQIAAFAESEADMVSALTLTNVSEAIGIVRAARMRAVPCMISFTVETDGKLVTGKSLREAIETVDRETDQYPLYYSINCAHPTHFEQAFEMGGPWLQRIGCIKANSSMRSHAELDNSDALDAGDPLDLSRRLCALRRTLPALKVLGGCCGTDHRLAAAICEALP